MASSGITVRTISGPEIPVSIQTGSQLSGIVAAGNTFVAAYLIENRICEVDSYCLQLATMNSDMVTLQMLLMRSTPQVLRDALYRCLNVAADQYFDVNLVRMLLPYCDPMRLINVTHPSTENPNPWRSTKNPLNVYIEKRFKHIVSKGHAVIIDLIVNACIDYGIAVDEMTSQDHLRTALGLDASSSVLQNLDKLWVHSYDTQGDNPVPNHIHASELMDLYKDMPQLRRANVEYDHIWNNWDYDYIWKTALDIGICRHVMVLLRNIKVFDLDQSTAFLNKDEQLKMIRFLHANKLYYLVRRSTNPEYMALWDWFDELDQLPSNIHWHVAENTDKRAIPTLIEQITSNEQPQKQQNREVTEVRKTVTDFMNSLAREISETEPLLSCIAYLVGSASEGTGCLVPNEFDFLLLFLDEDGHMTFQRDAYWKRGDITLSPTLRDRLLRHNRLSELVRKCVDKVMQSQQQSNVTIDVHTNVIHEKKFMALCLIWQGDEYKYLPIKIDLVPCVSLKELTPLTHHDYMPDSTPLQVTFHFDFRRADIGFSVIENRIIANLPEEIRKGYRLAKALRRPCFIAPIIPLLKQMGFTKDIEDLLRSYYLKNCVFFLTYNFKSNSTMQQMTAVDWTIRIYTYFRACLRDHGCVPHFFTQVKLFECNIKYDSIKRMWQPCCYELESMCMIAEHIVGVLEEYKRIQHVDDRAIKLITDVIDKI